MLVMIGLCTLPYFMLILEAAQYEDFEEVPNNLTAFVLLRFQEIVEALQYEKLIFENPNHPEVEIYEVGTSKKGLINFYLNLILAPG